MVDSGCQYITFRTKALNRKTGKMEDVPVFCNKVLDEGSPLYCPRHLAILWDKTEEPKRRAVKSANTRARKKMMREALEISPLAAINEDFLKKEKKNHGYSI